MGKEYTPYKMKGHTLPGINQRLDDHPAPTKILPILAMAGKALLAKKVKDTVAPPAKFIDFAKGAKDKLMMAATGGALGDKSKGTDRDSLMGNK